MARPPLLSIMSRQAHRQLSRKTVKAATTAARAKVAADRRRAKAAVISKGENPILVHLTDGAVRFPDGTIMTDLCFRNPNIDLRTPEELRARLAWSERFIELQEADGAVNPFTGGAPTAHSLADSRAEVKRIKARLAEMEEGR